LLRGQAGRAVRRRCRTASDQAAGGGRASPRRGLHHERGAMPPPGNRDPLPDEIEACRPYLSGTLDCVRPRVVVTLGNFATRVILDRQVSISRVRGQRFEIEGRTVIPTFHPAAVLHGGGEAGSQMTALRSDFQTIRQILDEPPPVAVAAEEQLGLF